MAAQRPEHAHATDCPATVTFPSRPAVTRTHDNWKSARQTSCRQQTAPPQQHCSKDVTAHPHWPGARPGLPCPVPDCIGQPPSGRSGFSSPFETEFLRSARRTQGDETSRTERNMMHADRVRSQHGDNVHKHQTRKLQIRKRPECLRRRNYTKEGKVRQWICQYCRTSK